METKKIVALVKAIRTFCLDYVGNSRREARLCSLTSCALYPFRLGKNPFSNHKGNIEFLPHKALKNAQIGICNDEDE